MRRAAGWSSGESGKIAAMDLDVGKIDWKPGFDIRRESGSALLTSKVLLSRKDSGAKSLCAREMERPMR